MTKEFIFNFLYPKHNITFFAIYLTFWKEIVFEKKWSNIFIIKLLISVTAYQAIKYVLIEFFNPSTITRIVLYEGFSLTILNKPGLNFMTAVIIVMVGWLLQLCYLKGDTNNFYLLEKLLFANQPKTFLWRHYKGQTVCNYLINFANQILIFGPVVVIVACMF